MMFWDVTPFLNHAYAHINSLPMLLIDDQARLEQNRLVGKRIYQECCRG
jgi:hypothetical protein